MQVWIGSTCLASDGVFGPGSLQVAGQKITEEVAFFRAAEAKLFDRGGKLVTVAFRVSWRFATAAEAELWLLTVWGLLPAEGDVTFFTGPSGSRVESYMLGAQLESTVCSHLGATVEVQHTLRGPPPQTSNPPAVVPDPDASAPADPMIQRARVTIASGAETKAVTFGTAFASAPIVTVSLEVPSGEPVISAEVEKDSVTTGGFTAVLGAATPSANYRLVYTAIAP